MMDESTPLHSCRLGSNPYIALTEIFNLSVPHFPNL